MIGFSFDSMASYFGETKYFTSGHGCRKGNVFKVTNFPEIGWPGDVYFLLLLLRDRGFDQEIGLHGQFYPLAGVGAAINIVAGMVDECRFLESFERTGNGLIFFNKLFKIDGLVAELPEMMFRIVLIAVGKKMKE